MTALQWRLCAVGDAEPLPGLLTPSERQRLGGLRFEKRRREWLAGRLCAKTLLAAELSRPDRVVHPGAVEIDTAASGAPYARLAPAAPPLGDLAPGARLRACVSISHCGATALAATLLADPARGWRLGCDVEAVEPRSAAFVSDYLTAEERVAVPPGDPTLHVNAVWSAKESVLKALGVGLRADTRRLSCHLAPRSEGSWSGFRVSAPDLLEPGRGVAGWWRVHRERVITLAVLPAPGAVAPEPPDRPLGG